MVKYVQNVRHWHEHKHTSALSALLLSDVVRPALRAYASAKTRHWMASLLTLSRLAMLEL